MASVDLLTTYGVPRVHAEHESGSLGNRIPEKCAVCPSKIFVGISFYMFACHLHAICSSCDIPEVRNKHGCRFCKEEKESKKKEQSQKPSEARNSLRLINVAQANEVAYSPVSQAYLYPPVFPTSNIASVTYIKDIGTDIEALSCWSIGDDDKIIAGGYNKHFQPVLTVVSDVGQLVTHVLSCGREVISGLLVKMWLHIVCVSYDDEFTKSNNRIHLVILDPTSTESLVITPLITLDVTNPVNLFRKSTELYGVLCMDGSFPDYTRGKIRLLGLNQMILPLDTDPCTIQSTALWGRRTLVHLDLHSPFVNDTVAVTPRGQFCIASWVRYEIRIYSGTGMYVYTIGEGQRSGRLHHGKLSLPVSVHCTGDNRVMVTGYNGDIQMYNLYSDTGTLMKKRYRRVYDNQENTDEDSDRNDTREVYYLKHDPAGWKIIKSSNMKTMLQSTMTSTRIWHILSDGNISLHKIIDKI